MNGLKGSSECADLWKQEGKQSSVSMYRELLQLETDTWGIYMIAARKMEITENELCILLEIFESDPPLCQADIARKLHIPVQTLNSALSKMMKKGWIELVPVRGSHKAKGVVLTEKGMESVGPDICLIHQAEITAFESLERQKAEEMLASIRSYTIRFEKEMNALFTTPSSLKS